MTGVVDTLRFAISGDSVSVLIDPDGELPTWSSDNLEMRRIFVQALGAVGAVDHFLTVAREHLRRDPDAHTAAQVLERLFESGRYGEVVETARVHPSAEACDDRQTCMAALQVARALVKQGRRAEARQRLGRIEASLSVYGRSAANRLQLLRAELESP
jgi:hypothetical protein